ncbi:iron chelate uptake ABC transporter family permease subunit [Rhodococcoides yunnanense]|uniref:iron chelate uptake ABC transporter family permease subunit n=1 Tax=Rhodococcoides yunnanense TaxID=278209 RepID=UPI00093355F2|nr:iron chelate uptake ABC transporter family permease subunit [Rhodococcus yunnanensis]
MPSLDAAEPARGETDPREARAGFATSRSRRLLWLMVGFVVLIVIALLSLSIGARPVPISAVVQSLFRYDGSPDHYVVVYERLPRTIFGLAVGIALGVAGATMQALTRNPLADPGLLGVNAGAGFAVTCSIAFLGIQSVWGYMWFAFAGAIAVSLLVYLVGATGRYGATPGRLLLAGVAIGAVLGGFDTAINLLDLTVFEARLHWGVGSLVGPGFDIAVATIPFMALGVILSLCIASSLNSIALGDDLASALGTDVVRIRIIGVIAIGLTCGAATAAVGPIAFIGLVIPHIARWIVGPNQLWIMLYTMVGAPALLLTADIVGRLILRPGEVEASIITAFLGAPVLVYLVRRKNASGL